MKFQYPERNRIKRAFTLLELLVSMAVLILILGIATALLGNASDLWMRQRGKAIAFEGANAAFEALTRSLGQATLNTHWGYDDPAEPTKFIRESELHFTMGRASDLLGRPESEVPTMGVFFQAPTGRSSMTANRRLPLLLNGLGYFVYFSDTPDLPPILNGIVPPHYRFRLMEWQEPTEDLKVYSSADWFKARIFSGGGLNNTSVVADNIIGLILMAEYPDENGVLKSSYIFDSRLAFSKASRQPAESNQLPPRVRVLMVAISEVSAQRQAAIHGTSQPPLIPGPQLFTDPLKFEEDLEAWETALQQAAPPVDYLVFNSVVHIQSAKWSVSK